MKEKGHYNSFVLKNPERLVVDLKGFDGSVPKKVVSINDGIIKQVRASRKSGGAIRIVLDLEKKSDHKIFPLSKIDGKPPRLVIDITRPDLEKAVRNKREKTRNLKEKGEYIVVVDPGHGGERRKDMHPGCSPGPRSGRKKSGTRFGCILAWFYCTI